MAESLEKTLGLADVYAAALFELASEAGRVAEVRAELEELVRLEQTDATWARFMRSDAIKADQRRASLERLLRGRLSDLLLNTLHVMNQHGRAGLLAALLRRYVAREEHAQGQIAVTATSAVELGAAEKARVERWAAERFGKQPLVRFVVDTDVLGGLIVQVGDYRFDHSLRRHLAVARGRLLERSERGLEIRTPA